MLEVISSQFLFKIAELAFVISSSEVTQVTDGDIIFIIYYYLCISMAI